MKIIKLNKSMNKFVLSIIVFTFFVANSYAQKVLGVDINTTSKKFEMAMSKKGYKPQERVSGEAIYNVTYAGYNNARMEVRIDELNDSITSIAFHFDNRPAKERSDIFYNLEKQFKAKYPEGKSSRHDWDVINTHQRWWNTEGISMMFDEVDGDFWIEYVSKHRASTNNVKPSDDI